MLAGSGSMLSNIFKQGSLVSASKPVGVLNKHAGNGAMLAWYQDKPTKVLSRPAGALSGKRGLVNALLCTWFVKQKRLNKQRRNRTTHV